tara:strand:+ start:170 stop:631 length:462 start_codon:yes stop_codon:yes gene_type:complete
MTEIESRYYDKIELLKALNVDIWLKKPNFPEIKKNIIIQTLLFEKHKGIIESFIKSIRNLEIDTTVKKLENDDLVDIVNSNQEKNKKCNFFIVCQKEVMNEMIDKNLKKSDNVYVNDTKDMIFVFNTLFESDKISNDMKKSVWKDLIYSLSYE